MSFKHFRCACAMVAIVTVTGCGGMSLPKIESDKIDYKSAQQLPPLEVPPDLSKPATDDRYAIPSAGAVAGTEGATTGAPAPVVAPQATLLKNEDGSSQLSVSDSFDRAWRRVGLALDRGGFTVEDRDRSTGIYRVRYLDPSAQPKEDGFLTKWLGFGKKAEPEQNRYQVLVKEKDSVSLVSVLDAAGNPDKSEAAGRITGLLYEQLK